MSSNDIRLKVRLWREGERQIGRRARGARRKRSLDVLTVKIKEQSLPQRRNHEIMTFRQRRERASLSKSSLLINWSEIKSAACISLHIFNKLLGSKKPPTNHVDESWNICYTQECTVRSSWDFRVECTPCYLFIFFLRLFLFEMVPFDSTKTTDVEGGPFYEYMERFV